MAKTPGEPLLRCTHVQQHICEMGSAAVHSTWAKDVYCALV